MWGGTGVELGGEGVESWENMGMKENSGKQRSNVNFCTSKGIPTLLKTRTQYNTNTTYNLYFPSAVVIAPRSKSR